MTIPKGTIASRAKANTTRRQKLKTKWDRHCKYGAESVDELPKSFQLEGTNFEADVNNGKAENWCRLLDEGVVVDNNFFTGEPYVYAVIKKSAIKEWYDTLPNSFVGTIDKDHNRSIGLGTFTKKDLRLVETDNGRYAVDVNVQLDHELYAVKDLLRENNRTALSVEMYVDADEYATAEKVTGDKSEGDYLVPLISKLKIEGYAVCLAPKSANSYKDDLLEKASATNTNFNEEFKMNDEEKKADIEEGLSEAEEQAVDAATGDPNAEPSNADPVVIDNTEDVENDEKEGQPVDAEAEDEKTDETEDAPANDGEDKLAAIEEQIKALKATIAEKDEKIASLEKQLSAKTTEQNDFESKLGSILALATSDEPTVDESATTPEKTGNDELVDAYSSAFKDLEN